MCYLHEVLFLSHCDVSRTVILNCNLKLQLLFGFVVEVVFRQDCMMQSMRWMLTNCIIDHLSIIEYFLTQTTKR